MTAAPRPSNNHPNAAHIQTMKNPFADTESTTFHAPAAETYGTEVERHFGPHWTKELSALPHVDLRARLAAAGPADIMRDSYPQFWSGERAPKTRAEALSGLAASFPNLSPSQADHASNLICFAVHTEMKHWADEEYVDHPDHKYELLVEPSDYANFEELVDRGQDDNRSRWADLANTVAAHALAANAAVRRAA